MNTLFTGRKIIELPLTGSTNSFALDLLKTTPLPEGTWIIAHEQKQGRGQLGNVWESEAGKNITASLVLYPSFLPLEKQFLLSKAISLAIYDLLHKNFPFGADIRIKWPNDIYADGKKIAGILIENAVRQSSLQHSVIGIGLNVNQDHFSVEHDMAGSMFHFAKKEFDLRELLEQLSAYIEARYLQLRAGKYKELNFAYLQLLLHYKKTMHYLVNGQAEYATITGVSENGKLEMKMENGAVQEFNMKEVVFPAFNSRP
jgi:BirA family biotin operon repressor/biotin-[acetyl-CoA-carboxylase] ligase